MKKKFAFLLALALLLLSAQSLADGLPGRITNSSECSIEELPDPYEVTGSYGTLQQTEYNYSADYNCDVYIYVKHEAMNTFIMKYNILASAKGYKMEALSIEGHNAWAFTNSNSKHTAYIIDYDDEYFMVLIESGMAFEASMTVQDYMKTAQFTSPTSNFAVVTIQGEPVIFYLAYCGDGYFDDTIRAEFYSYNEIGNKQYYLTISFSQDIPVGEYATKDFSAFGKYQYKHFETWLWKDYSNNRFYSSTDVYNCLGDYELSILIKSDDWQSYQISINVNSSDDIHDWLSSFEVWSDFTIGECNPVVYKMESYQ